MGFTNHLKKAAGPLTLSRLSGRGAGSANGPVFKTALIWLLLAGSGLYLLSLLPRDLPLWSRIYEEGDIEISLNQLDRQVFAGQAISQANLDGRIDFIRIMFATYDQQAGGRLAVSLLEGRSRPQNLAEIEKRAVFSWHPEAKRLADTKYHRFELPRPIKPKEDGFYLVVRAEEVDLQRPVTAWFSRYEGWQGPGADILTMDSGGGISSKPLPGHLAIGFGTGRFHSVLSWLLTRAWGVLLLVLGLFSSLLAVALIIKAGERLEPGEKSAETWSSGGYLLLIGLAVFLLHGSMLTNNGLLWDDWANYARYGDWSMLRNIYFSSGNPASAFLHGFVASLPQPFLTCRWLVFGSLLITSGLLYLILGKMGLASPRDGLWLVVLSLYFPAYTVSDMTANMPYHIFYLFFMLGTFMEIKSEEEKGWRHIFYRISSLALFVASFPFNSLLVYYLAAYILLFIKIGQVRKINLLSSVIMFWWKRIDYLMIPFLYFVTIKTLFPAHGFYAYNNAFTSFSRAINVLTEKFISNGILLQFERFISFVVGHPLILVPALIITGLMVMSERKAVPQGDRGSRWPSWKMLAAGAGLLILAITPYAAVGKGPEDTGMSSRHAFFISLPMAFLILGVIRSLAPSGRGWRGRTGTFLLVLFVLWSGSYLVQIQVGDQARWVKDRSIMTNLPRLDQAGDYSVFWIYDHYHLGQAQFYRFYEWCGIFRRVFGDEKRVGFDLRNYTPADLENQRNQMIDIFNCGQVDLGGKGVNLHLEPGPLAMPPLGLVFHYQWKSVFDPRGLERMLRQVVHLRLEPLDQE